MFNYWTNIEQESNKNPDEMDKIGWLVWWKYKEYKYSCKYEFFQFPIKGSPIDVYTNKKIGEKENEDYVKFLVAYWKKYGRHGYPIEEIGYKEVWEIKTKG